MSLHKQERQNARRERKKEKIERKKLLNSKTLIMEEDSYIKYDPYDFMCINKKILLLL